MKFDFTPTLKSLKSRSNLKKLLLSLSRLNEIKSILYEWVVVSMVGGWLVGGEWVVSGWLMDGCWWAFQIVTRLTWVDDSIAEFSSFIHVFIIIVVVVDAIVVIVNVLNKFRDKSLFKATVWVKDHLCWPEYLIIIIVTLSNNN